MLFSKQIILLSEIFGVDEEDPYQDSGSEYLPTRSPSPTAVDLLDILADNQQDPGSPQNDQEQRKPRKRVRQPSKWKRQNALEGRNM